MIEATCAACGTVNRIAEAEVPPGAKFVSCASCKSKVPVAVKAVPAIPKLPTKIPAIPKVPTPAKGIPAPAKRSDALDLADLPAPKRQSPLAGADAASKPAPRSALAGAELPAPKASAGPELPAPKPTAKPPAPQPAALDLDDLMPPADPSSAAITDLPAPKAAPRSALADLPAPKAAPRSALADLPMPKAKSAGLADLPAPKAGLADLPAPKAGLADLPAPKAAALGDLPAPKKPAGITDLPAPKGPLGLTDLPMPKGPPAGGTLDLDEELDLPMPAAGITDLPAPKPGANGDLLAPKGFFDDLPQPAQNAPTQDIAPKGFFDDLPQPAKNAPTQDVAPKGFFDDLPQPAKKATQDVAPKGFFDDLPQPAKKATQDVAPKGFFDDLPQPSKPAAGPASGGLFDDLPQPGTKSPADMALGAGDIDLGPPSSGPGLELDSGPALDLGGPGLELDLGGSGAARASAAPEHASDGPELDLGLPLGEGPAFQDLDLSEPTPKPTEPPSPIKIKTPAKGAEKKPIPINVPQKGGDLKLDLAEDPHDAARIGAPAASTARKVTPKKKAASEESAAARVAKKKRTRLVLASLLGVAALGAGGFYFYQRHAAAKAKADEIASQLQTAEKALVAADANHWTRAKRAADQALELDSTNPRAVGLAAEAAIAGAIDTGINADARIKQGRALIQQALGAGRTSPELERAQAVGAIVAKGQAQRAVDLLKAQIAKAPKNGWLHLYMGWAQLEKGDSAEAIKAFDQAIALAPATKLPALYGQGQAKLLVADIAGARTAFETILQAAKDHVCANIGLIATKPPSVEQVQELEAVLQRKDIGSADPRCVVHAYTLIGDVHRAAGRLDMARQRYNDALKLVPLDIATHDGLAAVELRDGKLELANDHIQKALAVNADHPDTLLLLAELDVRQGKLPDAEELIEKLANHKPPLPTLAQAHLAVVRGNLLETKGELDAAVDAYVEGSKIAGDLDLTPTMEATRALGELAKKATDPAKAAAYRTRADQLLSGLATRAQDDAQLSTTLGIAYLRAGDAAKAETYLRRAAEMNENDPEARLQYAKALSAQGKADDAIRRLEEAQKLAPERTDIALELAKTYQQANRPEQAIAAYDKLLALPDVAIIVRVKAGRYFAQHGMIEKAAAQAEPILAAEPENPAGLYLKAEGLIAAGKPEEAAPLLTRATDVDPDAQYLDALGRALEARLAKSGDTKYIEGARFAYERAAKADPTLFHAWLGQGKMLVANKGWDAAIKVLLEANKLDKGDAATMYYTGLAYHGLRNSGEQYQKAAVQWLAAALKASKELALADRADAWFKVGELHRMLNKAGDAGRAVQAWENATRLGEELEKQGTSPAWLTETYYELGDLYSQLGSPAQQARAWHRYVDRKPKPGVRLTTAVQALGTSLKQF